MSLLLLFNQPAGGGGPVTYTVSIGGTLTLSSAIRRKASRAFGGSLTAFGVAPKRSQAVPRASSMSPSGALSLKLKFGRTVAGSLTASGAVRKKVSRVLVGSLAASGAVLKRTRRAVQGSLAVAGAVARRTRRVLSGTLTLTATIARGLRLPKALAGALTAAGSVAGNKIVFSTTAVLRGAKALYSMLSRR